MDRVSRPYPYAGRDLFAEPESYFYADCDDSGYLQGWKTSRDEARTRLVERVAAKPTTDDGSVADGLAATLDRCLDAVDRAPLVPPDVLATLGPFVVKFEVHRRLFTAYGPDGRRSVDAPVAGPAEYVRFAACLARIAEKTDRLKYVSTLVKLMDALMTLQPERFSAHEAAWLVEIVDRERALVERWESHVDDAA